MAGPWPDADSVARFLLSLSVRLALAMTAAVVIERAVSAVLWARREYIQNRYGPLAHRALSADSEALRRLADIPARHRLSVARPLLESLIDDRDRALIVSTRAVVDALSIIPIADRYLRSWLWWRRAVALRALGVLQLRHYTAAGVAALDDPHPDVRAAALDALTYMQDVASLGALVVRLHDTSLQPARRLASLAAFGSQCEEFLLELSEFDVVHLANYAQALAICGTRRSRPVLARWTQDARPEVRAAAFDAFAHVGVDHEGARLAIAALENGDEAVRAMAASALNGWTASTDAATHLARHLDDAWPVAVRAARSLRSMGDTGMIELHARAARPDLVGRLARQTLSTVGAAC